MSRRCPWRRLCSETARSTTSIAHVCARGLQERVLRNVSMWTASMLHPRNAKKPTVTSEFTFLNSRPSIPHTVNVGMPSFFRQRHDILHASATAEDSDGLTTRDVLRVVYLLYQYVGNERKSSTDSPRRKKKREEDARWLRPRHEPLQLVHVRLPAAHQLPMCHRRS